MSHCENNKYRFAILDAKRGQADISLVDPRSDRPSLYAAFYNPWIRIFDADTGGLASWCRRVATWRVSMRAVMGSVACTKPRPTRSVRGVLELEFEVTTGQQESLNPRGLNAIRAFPGRGRRVWGAQTISAGPHSGNTSMFGVSLSSWKLPSSEAPSG